MQLPTGMLTHTHTPERFAHYATCEIRQCLFLAQLPDIHRHGGGIIDFGSAFF